MTENSTEQTISKLGRLSLLITVMITGASVMVIELLGTRLIAPFYGTSLYVWSSLISVTMVALTLGYFIGGRWSDSAKRTGLSLIIALAAFLTLMIPWLTRPVLLATDSLGLRGGAFVSALVLFLPSLMMLGMVSPFAIKLSTSQLDNVGNSSGTIYAVSTLGSVFGTLILGLYLFPLFGSREILITTSVILFILAIAIGLIERQQLQSAAMLLPSVILVVIGLGLVPSVVKAGEMRPNDKFQTRFAEESLYGWVRVIDQPARDLRLLTSDGSAIGASSIKYGVSQLSYQDIVGLIPALRPKMTKALIVGLGAGHMAKVLNDRYGIIVDTLEIDPAVAQAAVDYFDYKPTGKAIVGDARYEIRRLTDKYDLIIHDCFTGGSEPAHLLTVETLQQLQGLLTEQGILAVNFVAFSSGKESALSTVSKTLAQVFEQQMSFISEPNKDFNDFIFLASAQPFDIHNERLKIEQQAWLQNRLFPIDNKDGLILTDNYNPLEHLQIAKAEKYRHFLIDMFGEELFLR